MFWPNFSGHESLLAKKNNVMLASDPHCGNVSRPSSQLCPPVKDNEFFLASPALDVQVKTYRSNTTTWSILGSWSDTHQGTLS